MYKQKKRPLERKPLGMVTQKDHKQSNSRLSTTVLSHTLLTK